MIVQPLRGYGPRVFISYSFQDSAIAERLHAALETRGCQVRREDDTTMFNQRLVDAIPRRIGDAEVLIQFMTTAANRSDWVALELKWILERRQAREDVVFLPIVFDKATLPESVKDWWFLDLSGRELTDTEIEKVARMCTSVVHVLRLAEHDPLSVVDSDLEALLTAVPRDGKRIIFDSDGLILRWAQDAVESAEQMATPSQSFIAQERRRRDRLVRRFKVLDEVIRRLAIEVMRVMETYTDEPLADGATPMTSFLRIMLADLLVTAEKVSPPEHPLRTTFKTRIDDAGLSFDAHHAGAFMNPGLYAWAFGVEGGADSMASLKMFAPEFRSVRVCLPTTIFGQMADIYIKTPVRIDPRAELLTGTFVDYVLPQIALEAFHDMLEPMTVRRDLEEQYAWRLDQYREMR